MQAFRARLVDAMDEVLRLAAEDDGYRFVLDGQTILLEDYLAVRPDRRAELVERVTTGQLGIGPWFVQPDSLLPSGESLVRNLLAGRREAAKFGACSTVAYLPDSFGHPAQLPQIFVGFGLDGFVYWRGNGDEIDELGPRWRWRAPDGSSVRALHLTDGYFNAARIPTDTSEAVKGLADLHRKLDAAGESPVLLMNGFDHTRPDPHVAQLPESLADLLGEDVRRSLLDDAVVDCPSDLPEFAGELVGARLANLLAGVWSARMPLKVRNRSCELLLERWAEPWAALGEILGLTSEGPALRLAWRSLLANQAHDSICGCSVDAVHERMAARYDDAEGLAAETLVRSLERLAGRNQDRDVPGMDDLHVAVFNPTPHPRTDVVRVALEAHPALPVSFGEPSLHPLVEFALGDLGFEVDGGPARTITSDDPGRLRWIDTQRALDIEFVARDVPAFGYRRFRLQPAGRAQEIVDSGTRIEADGIRVEVEAGGTLTVVMGEHRWEGLFAVEDIGDRGDSYDFEPVGVARMPAPTSVDIRRVRSPAGVQTLSIDRVYAIPESLDADREKRSDDLVDVPVSIELVIGAGVDHIRGELRVDNTALDHRLRVAFPTGHPSRTCLVATTFDVVQRSTGRCDSSSWVHPAPSTFCQQGLVTVNGLCVVAPGLPEAEVTPEGVIFLTLVRSVGWLARYDLASRPVPAGPAMETPGAQTQGVVTASFVLLAGAGAAEASDIGCGLRGVIAGPAPRFGAGKSLLQIDDDRVLFSAMKPADDGNGLILRLLNPTDEVRTVSIELGFSVSGVESVQLDEVTPVGSVAHDGSTVGVDIGPHAFRTLRMYHCGTPASTALVPECDVHSRLEVADIGPRAGQHRLDGSRCCDEAHEFSGNGRGLRRKQ